MKRWNWLIAAALSCLGTLNAAPPTVADELGWGMLVRSPLAGMLYVYISNEGFAIVVPKTGAKFVTHGPDWRIVLYNDRSHLYFVEKMNDLQAFAQKRVHNAAAVRRVAQGARVGKTQKTPWGMTETQYFINTYSADSGIKPAEAWITHDIHPPAQFAMVLNKLCQVDTSNYPEGMPLKVSVKDDVGKTSLVFETLKCERQTIHTASFEYPHTYKRAESEIAVLVDEQSRKKMESILEDSEDLNSLLGPSSQPSRPTTSYPSTYHPQPYATTRPAYNPPSRPMTQPAQPAKKQTGDWWNNMFNSLGGK